MGSCWAWHSSPSMFMGIKYHFLSRLLRLLFPWREGAQENSEDKSGSSNEVVFYAAKIIGYVRFEHLPYQSAYDDRYEEPSLARGVFLELFAIDPQEDLPDEKPYRHIKRYVNKQNSRNRVYKVHATNLLSTPDLARVMIVVVSKTIPHAPLFPSAFFSASFHLHLRGKPPL